MKNSTEKAERKENLEKPGTGDSDASQPHSHSLSPRLAKQNPSGPPVCKFDDFGCQYKGTKEGIRRHVDTEPVRHLSLLGDAVSTLKKEVLGLNAEVGDRMEEMDNIYTRHDRMRKRYGSHLLWKISGYKEKMQLARSGVQTVIFSPAFLTAAHGYKMMASAALNGDGKGRDKFVSIFICILEGTYDSLLAWPFSHSVTFTILDQSENVGQRRDISYTIAPNSGSENETYLGRPKKERNPSFGYQRFAEISALETMEYVKDDNLFIKIQVDETDMDVL